MSFTEYTAIVPDEQRLDWLAYSFFQSRDGKTVAVEFDAIERNTVVKVHVLEKAICTAETIKDIENGMPLLEVIAKIGNPVKARGDNLIFRGEGETWHWLKFDSDYMAWLIRTYEKDYAIVSEEKAREIQPGMTISEVISVIGPYDGDVMSANYPFLLFWYLDDGRKFYVNFDCGFRSEEYAQKLKDGELYGVNLRSEATGSSAYIEESAGSRTSLFDIRNTSR